MVELNSIGNMSAESWLRKLLDVPGGDIVTAEDVGFAPPGRTFEYSAPGRLNAQRRKMRRYT